MFIDTRRVEQGAVIETTVCIIGGGVAGITLAMELDKKGIEVCLLESGGFNPDDDTRDLYRGEDVGEWRYNFADGSRSRFLGGSSNCWGGWCRPLDPWDFEKREWIAHSGWPFGLSELAPYYERTHALLKLGPNNFDPEFWERSINRSDVRRIPLVTGKVRDTISQFSPPARFGKLYRDTLKRSQRVRVFLYANATNIDTDSSGQKVTHIDVATLSGRRLKVCAKLYVLATGGIENARMLLASNKVQRAGLGNANDLVGRFFMDHPRLFSGNIKFAKQWSRNKLSDVKYHYMNAAVAAHGTCIAHQFALTSETLREERLLNARVWFSSVFPGEGSEGAQALFRCKQALLKKEQAGWKFSKDLMMMLSHPVDTMAYGYTRLFQPRWLIQGVKFQLIVEPEPDPNSRVMLSPSQKDQLGMNRVRVDWRLTSNVQRTFDRTLAILAEDMRRSGVAEVELDPPIEGRKWPADLEGTWHHMGTTRMHDSPKHGVVDRQCKVHGMTNLYVAGSSVFPTAGANFPTITLAALAFRLAEHIVVEVRSAGANFSMEAA
ncbi:FAD-dependent oxidoreductase [Noviherbaspirillum sp. UKPF54]|uniref:FAD-dependent oxidoreductase n=1 Tax=Noviherbaspirillum sp. UKPF54 TaxID=2601898 RepID=UPI0011B1B929|nr:GMC family oxidoreductase [Noviherbaspirillum sp. UKPF54]QDZ27473.1 GMC family oxidoreductase [Noviherbaspirillum sp. UKPF54]